MEWRLEPARGRIGELCGVSTHLQRVLIIRVGQGVFKVRAVKIAADAERHSSFHYAPLNIESCSLRAFRVVEVCVLAGVGWVWLLSGTGVPWLWQLEPVTVGSEKPKELKVPLCSANGHPRSQTEQPIRASLLTFAPSLSM